LELDKDQIQMVGNDLRKQVGAFRNVGAPNLDKVSARTKVGDLKIAFIGVILSLEAGVAFAWTADGRGNR